MNIKFILVVVIFALPIISVAQNIPTLMNLPAKYAEGPDGDVLDDSKKDKSTQMWIVFSDRDDNNTYDKPAQGAAINTVNFLDKFYVTDESGDFLEVYKWAEGIKLQSGEKKVQLNPKKAERVGWIKKENLLLWNRCLKEKTTDFAERGFIVLTEKKFRTIASSSSEKPGTFFSSPDLQKGNNNTAKAFQILYVYKRLGKSVLIGKVYKSNIYHADKDILGWVDESVLKLWNNRLFIEPNWDNDAVSERKNTGIKTSLFVDKTEVVQWKDGKATQPRPIWDEDPFEKRWPGSKQRFPVFETDSGIIYTGFYSPLFKDSIELKAEGVFYLSKTTDTFAQKALLINPLVTKYFQNIGVKISDSVLLNKFTGKYQQFFIPAWTSLSVNKMQAPIFKIGIYISEDELLDMIDKFEKLQFDESPTAIRKLMYNAYQSLAESYWRKEENVSKKMKNELSIDDIFSKITGLPSSSRFLKDVKLNNIKDVKNVSDEQIEQIRKTIRVSLELLKSVAKDLNNTMRDASENGVYYWIPGHYFP